MTTIDERDIRGTSIDLLGDAGAVARVAAAAAARRITPSRWAGDRLLTEVERVTGYRDTARRRSRRAPNQQPREDRQGDRHLSRITIRVSREEKQRITDLAASKGMTVTDWAWTVLENALSGQP